MITEAEKKKQENPNCEKLQQVDMSLETTE